MKKLTIITDEKHAYTTPATTNGQEIRDLETYHVKEADGTLKEVPSSSIMVYWLEDMTTGDVECWSRVLDEPAGNIYPASEPTVMQTKQGIKDKLTGTIEDKPANPAIDYRLARDLQKDIGVDVSLDTILEIGIKAGMLNTDGTATKSAIDNGYIAYEQ